MKLAVLIALAAAALSGQTTPAQDEAALRIADETWQKAIASKSIVDAVAVYDPEALTAGSAMPPARGLVGIRAMWTKLFARSGFSLRWHTEKVVLTDSGTIAIATGLWRGDSLNSGGPFLAVWRKQPDGEWKVLVDSAWHSPPPDRK
jgi:ketosteroid isomerase-like protein